MTETTNTHAGAFRRGERTADKVVAAAKRRPGELGDLRATFERRRAELLANEDLTQEARSKRVRELEADYEAAYAEETAEILGRLDGEIEAAFRRAYGAKKPPRYSAVDVEEELLKELRLQRIRAEVVDEFVAGAD